MQQYHNNFTKKNFYDINRSLTLFCRDRDWHMFVDSR